MVKSTRSDLSFSYILFVKMVFREEQAFGGRKEVVDATERARYLPDQRLRVQEE